MKRIIVVLIALGMFSSLTMAEDLKKLSLDDVSALGTTIQADLKMKTEGESSVRVTTKHPTTICLGEIDGLDVENAKLIYQAKVKSDLDGVAYLEMLVQVGKGTYFSKGMNDVVKGKSKWKTIQTPFMFQKGQKPEKITLNLVINGKGTVWVDDVILSRVALK